MLRIGTALEVSVLVTLLLLGRGATPKATYIRRRLLGASAYSFRSGSMSMEYVNRQAGRHDAGPAEESLHAETISTTQRELTGNGSGF